MTKNRCGYRVFGVCVLLVLAVAAMGTVAAQDAVEVSDAQDLQAVSDDLNGDYVLVDDIDLSGVDNFEPIGSFEDPFTGTFDGDGYSVTNLYIERDDEVDVGLFGAVGPNGVVTDVELEDVSVSGDSWVGALVGVNQGDVTDSGVTGEVLSVRRVGLLVGDNEGRVSRSYAAGNVTAEDIAGGLVGRNEGELSQSRADVSVAGFADVDAFDMGGLVGVNLGQVKDSYATGEVLGDFFLGGLVGANDGDISSSYAAAEVIGDEDTGGIVGDLNFGESGATVQDSYWDTEATGQSDAVGSQTGNPTVSNVEGLTTDEMQGDSAETSMSALDFTAAWLTVSDPDGYPALAWEMDTATGTFVITGLSAPEEVEAGETFSVEATVENTADVAGTQHIEFRLAETGEELDESTVADSVAVELGAGDESVAVFGGLSVDSEGEYDHGVFSLNDSETATLTVLPANDTLFESPIQEISDELWTGVTEDGNLSLTNLGTVIQIYQSDPSNAAINGEPVDLGTLGSLIQYYISMQQEGA